MNKGNTIFLQGTLQLSFSLYNVSTQALKKKLVSDHSKIKFENEITYHEFDFCTYEDRFTFISKAPIAACKFHLE